MRWQVTNTRCPALPTIRTCGALAWGMLPDATYPNIDARMEHGDSLLLYTDGAIEVMNAEGQELGKDGLENILLECIGESGRVLDRIEENLLRFNKNIRLEDDLTLVLVTWP